MAKGHNKENSPKSEHKGGNEHLKSKKASKINTEKKGRNKNDDQSGGAKGKNSI